jgi:hypothetical protein
MERKRIIFGALAMIIVCLLAVSIALESDLSNDASVELSNATEQHETEQSSLQSTSGSSVEFTSVVLLILSITTLFSTAISFFLYRWRKILLSSPQLLVPEELGKYLQALEKSINVQEKQITKDVRELSLRASESTDKITNMTETFMSLQKALDDKDELIRRLMKGYDTEIFRKFLIRFIRIDQAIDDYIRFGDADAETLKQLKRLFEDALDECGVESFEPQVGGDYRKEDGLADHPKTLSTDDPNQDFKVAEVVELGYRLRVMDEYETIKPAKVSIYRTET